jgi:hypothetical protein
VIPNEPTNLVYDRSGTNQPYIGNMARALDNQFGLGYKYLSTSIFSPNQQRFLADFLKDKYPDTYSKMINPDGGIS